MAGRRTRYDYDQAGRLKAEEIFEAGATLPLAWHYSYYNQNGELTWSDGPQFDPEDYVWRDYDGAGRKTVEVRWRSRAKPDGSGLEPVPGDALYSIAYFNYDPAGNLTNTVDPSGNYSVMSYDAAGRLIRQVAYDAAGSPLATNGFAYEPGGQITLSTNGLGGVTQTLFNQAGLPFFRQNPDGSTNGWRYDLLRRVVTEFQPNGSRQETVYNDAQRAVVRLFKDPGGALLAGVTNQFDRRGNLITNIDAAGNAFFTLYDGLDRAVSSGGPPTVPGVSTQRVSFTYYDAAGIWVTNDDSAGQRVVTRFDALQRPILTEVRDRFQGNALLLSRAVSYSSNHHSVLSARGTAGGTVSGPVQHRQELDELGNVVLAFPLLPQNVFVRSTYDPAGRLAESVDELGRATTFTYDGLGRLSSKRLPDGATLTHGYNAEGGLTSLVLPGGLTWNATYNAANARTGEQLSNGAALNRQFTNVIAASGPLAGLVQSTIDLGRAVTNRFTYDAFGRVITNAASGPLPEQAVVTSYQYDKRGLVTDRSRYVAGALFPATITRVYDGYGEITFEQTRLPSFYNYSFNQVWDAAGRRARLTEKQATDVMGTVDFGYQADGQMTSATLAGWTSRFAYEDSGLLWLRSNAWRRQTVLERLGNGKPDHVGTWTGPNYANYVFDEAAAIRPDSRLASYTAARAGSGAWNETRAFGYNARCQLTNEGVGLANGLSATNTFTFDPDRLGFLTGAEMAGGWSNRWLAAALTPLGQVAGESWNEYGLKLRANGAARNASSNWVTLDGGLVGSVLAADRWYADLSLAPGPHTLAAAASYAAGQYTATATSAFTVLGTNGVSNYYDAAGNVVARVFPGAGVTNRTQTLKWDAEGRLVSVAERDPAGNGFDWSAGYDALGRRWFTLQTPVVSNTPNSQLTTRVDAWFDPEVEFQELGVSVNGDRTLKLLGPDLDGEYGGLQGVGGLEATIGWTNGTITPVLNDYFGNVLATLSGTNVLWNPARVSGYGVVRGYQAPQLGPTGPLAEALVWRNRRIDPTGFYWLGARYYDPGAGRFLSADPAGHASSMDLYAFADGDPVNQFDADGRFVAGIGNGIGYWASEAYATAGNLLDALMRPFATERYGLEHFSGGYEADPNYMRDYWNGSTAFQMGHVAGYLGTELGVQFGLAGAAKGLGMLARAATLRSAGMAVEVGARATVWSGAARAAQTAAAARAGAGAVVETSAARAAGGVARTEARTTAAASSMARSESYEAAARELAQPGPEGARAAAGGKAALEPDEFEVGEVMPNGEIAGLGPGAMLRSEITGFDSKKSAKLLEWLKKRSGGQLYGFIQNGKVTLIHLPPKVNFGHQWILDQGIIKPSEDLRAFSVMKYEGREFIFASSEVNPEGNYHLSKAHISQLQKLLRIIEVKKNTFL